MFIPNIRTTWRHMPLARCASHHRNQVRCRISCEASYLSGPLMFCDGFSPGTTGTVIHRSKKDGSMLILAECIAGIKYK